MTLKVTNDRKLKENDTVRIVIQNNELPNSTSKLKKYKISDYMILNK